MLCFMLSKRTTGTATVPVVLVAGLVPVGEGTKSVTDAGPTAALARSTAGASNSLATIPATSLVAIWPEPLTVDPVDLVCVEGILAVVLARLRAVCWAWARPEEEQFHSQSVPI